MPTETTEDKEQAYDSGWHLREMGHTEMLNVYPDAPELRSAFERGWNAAAEWRKEKDGDAESV
jgi:hypothetical protein